MNFVQHTHPSNAAAVIKRLKNLIRPEPRDCMNLTVKKPQVTAGSRPPNRRTIFKDREDEGVVTAKQHRGVSIHSLHLPSSRYQFSARLVTQNHAHDSNVSLQSNLTPRMSRLGLDSMGTPDKPKSPWGGYTVLDLLTTKALLFWVQQHTPTPTPLKSMAEA